MVATAARSTLNMVFTCRIESEFASGLPSGGLATLRTLYMRQLRAIMRCPAHLSKMSNREVLTRARVPDIAQVLRQEMDRLHSKLQALSGSDSILVTPVLCRTRAVSPIHFIIWKVPSPPRPRLVPPPQNNSIIVDTACACSLPMRSVVHRSLPTDTPPGLSEQASSPAVPTDLHPL